MFDFKLFRKANKLTQRQAADYFGCEQSFISLIETGRSKIPNEFISKILAEEEFDKSMIILEKGEKNMRSVPLLPIEAVAGFPNSDNDGITYADCDQYMVPEFEQSGFEFVIRVSGSSMYPKYSNGDILACKKIHEILFFQWGKVYVIDSSQGALVKRVFEDKENPDNILLVSDNKENYPPFSIPKSDIRSLSIVLGVIRME